MEILVEDSIDGLFDRLQPQQPRRGGRVLDVLDGRDNPNHNPNPRHVRRPQRTKLEQFKIIHLFS